MNKKNDASFLFLPLGGVGEIGMNLALYGYGCEESREWIIVDMGVSFAGPEDAGADLIMPDIRFLENERHNIKALLLTHGHEDHYGAVLYLANKFNWPIYCGKFTAHLLEAKRVGDGLKEKLPLKIFQPGDQLKIGQFSVEPIRVNHSIPDSVSFAIKTKLGTVIHTGDWKIDENPPLNDTTDLDRFSELGKEGILALICDSTNAMQENKNISEKDVEEHLKEIIQNQEGRVAITTFSSNVGRIRSIAFAAQEAGRKVLLMGRSMKRTVGIAEELGYMKGLASFLKEEDFHATARKKLVIILTGSQGEQRAALAKIAKEEMKNLTLSPGDTVIYSARSIPGNERLVLDIQNRLADLGIRIIDNHDERVHVSGHPYRQDLKRLYKLVQPKLLIPVHGEALHLNAHAEFGRECGIETVLSIRNGHMVQLAPKNPSIIDEVPVGRIYKDGRLIGSEKKLGMIERRKLNHVGHVSVFLSFDPKRYNLIDMDLSTYGVPKFTDENENIEEILLDFLEHSISHMNKSRRRDYSLVKERVKKLVHSKLFEIWGKKPVVTVFVLGL